MFRHMTVAMRMRVVIALSLVPVLLLSAFLLQRTEADIAFADKERSGLAYLSSIWPAYVTAVLADPGRNPKAAPLGEQMSASVGKAGAK